MTIFPIGLLLLALLAFVVGVAAGSTLLDYVSIIASGVAFLLVLVLGRFGRAQREKEPRLRQPRQAARQARFADNASLFAGYEDLRLDERFRGEDMGDGEERLPAVSPVGQASQAASSGTRQLPSQSYGRFEPEPTSLLAERLRERPTEGDSKTGAGPPTQAVTVIPARPERSLPFDREQEADTSLPDDQRVYAADDTDSGDDGELAVGEEWFEFPIADYDDLRLDEVVPLLPELEADEIDVVRQRELAGANRGMILRRLDILEARLTGPQLRAPTSLPPSVPGDSPAFRPPVGPVAPPPPTPVPSPPTPSVPRPPPAAFRRPPVP
ncbi:MAG: hypothetical protein ACRDX8_07545, partial [Acidimicrobiales bacterium]